MLKNSSIQCILVKKKCHVLIWSHNQSTTISLSLCCPLGSFSTILLLSFSPRVFGESLLVMLEQSEVCLKAPVRHNHVCQSFSAKTLHSFFFFNMTSSKCWGWTAPRLHQVRWDEFNLIITADVSWDYFVKHLFSPENWVSHFHSKLLFHTLLHRLSLWDAASSEVKCFTQWDFNSRQATNFKFISHTKYWRNVKHYCCYLSAIDWDVALRLDTLVCGFQVGVSGGSPKWYLNMVFWRLKWKPSVFSPFFCLGLIAEIIFRREKTTK